MSKTIGCKFCTCQVKSWTALFSHSMGYHPIQYIEVQRWLKARSKPTQGEVLEDEWEGILKGLGVKIP